MARKRVNLFLCFKRFAIGMPLVKYCHLCDLIKTSLYPCVGLYERYIPGERTVAWVCISENLKVHVWYLIYSILDIQVMGTSHLQYTLYLPVIDFSICVFSFLLILVITFLYRYIKDYDGGILMECKIDPKLPYTDLSTMIHRQRQV